MTQCRVFGIAIGVLLFFNYTNSAYGSLKSEKWHQAIQLAKLRCAPQTTDEKILYQDEFSWFITRDQMQAKFTEIYSSGKRLNHRSFYHPATDKFYLVYKYANKISRVELNERFIQSVIGHVEKALKMNYAEFIFFPDMGHSHLYVPEDYYYDAIAPLPIKESHIAYEKMLSYPKTQFLYHTAEQLRLKDDDKKLLLDPLLQWRYYSRNPMGDNLAGGKMDIHKNLQAKYNTVDKFAGFRAYSGYNISASNEACFPYVHNNKTYFFDLSLYDLESKPGTVFF